MKLINVTNSHSRLVMQQLESTDAELVKVYTAGDITVVYTVAPTHYEILLVNEKRTIMKNEIRDIKNYFFKKMPTGTFDPEHFTIIEEPHLVELSIPIHA